MQRTSSSKRSRSSSTQPETSPDTDHHETAAKTDLARDQEADEKMKMPAFLRQTQADLSAKFQELMWLERNRLLQGTLEASPDHEWKTAQGPHTRLLDRYQNVQPWEQKRIHLRVPEGQNDYINASPISLKSSVTGKENKYIAMQGPKEGTTSHVWRMVWHELGNPAVIVMLTETHDGSVEKCYPYFPRDPDTPPLGINDDDEFGDGFKATVRCLEVEGESQPGKTEVRKLVMKVEGHDEEKIIWHLLYSKWPDFGILAVDDLVGLFSLMDLSKAKNSGPENSRVIHCSAGVGRSGTFIALEHLIAELEADGLKPEEGQDDSAYDPVFDTVNKLREQRRTMVQADSQYYFIYTVLRQLWEKKYLKREKGEPTAKVAKIGGMEDVFS